MSADPDGDLGVAAGVAWCEDGPLVAVAVLPTGPVLLLEGAASPLWRSLATHGDPRQAVAETLTAMPGAPEDGAEQLGQVIAQLTAAGVLVRRDGVG